MRSPLQSGFHLLFVGTKSLGVCTWLSPHLHDDAREENAILLPRRGAGYSKVREKGKGFIKSCHEE